MKKIDKAITLAQNLLVFLRENGVGVVSHNCDEFDSDILALGDGEEEFFFSNFSQGATEVCPAPIYKESGALPFLSRLWDEKSYFLREEQWYTGGVTQSGVAVQHSVRPYTTVRCFVREKSGPEFLVQLQTMPRPYRKDGGWWVYLEKVVERDLIEDFLE